MMKKTKLLALALFTSVLFACAGCGVSNTNSASSPNAGNSSNVNNTMPPNGGGSPSVESIAPINVIMVNDNHGMLQEEEGSFDKIATGINEYVSQGDTVKIANGDMFQGTYVSSTLRGLPMLEALNALDFDAFVIGNHEFDWGLDEIKKYKDGDHSNGEADFPFLGANIYDKSTGEMVDWLEPYTVVEFNSVKIGVIGIIGEVESSILSAHVENYDFVDATEIVKDLAQELRTEKACDVVLVAAHADDDLLNETLVSYDGVSKIDGIFTGHYHVPTDNELTRADGSSVCVLQNGGYGESFAVLTLEFNGNGTLKSTQGQLRNTSEFESTGILSPVFEKYQEQIAIGDTVICTLNQDVSRYDLGIEVAHSMYLKYGTDFAVINSGGVRTSVSAGDVTYADVFQVLPFENEVYIVTLSGERLKSYLQNSGGVYYWGIDVNSLEDNQSYRLAIVDFVYLGDTFADYRNDSVVSTNDLIRDVFIERIIEMAG